MSALPAFLGVAVLVIVSPGQDTALTIRNTLLGGRSMGVATGAGCVLGQCVWGIATSAGLGALIVASQPAFLVLRIAGAAYLVYLGISSVIAALRRVPHHRDAAFASRRPMRRRTALRQGLLSNLGNAKMAVFFLSLLPQFATSFIGLELHALLFAGMTLAWLTLYAFAVAKMSAVLIRPRIRRVLDTVTGLALVAFGVRLATEQR